jgi:HAD domain in Swiss Army Knife RNA repair proteins
MNARIPQLAFARPRHVPFAAPLGKRSATDRKVKVARRVLFLDFDGVLHPTVIVGESHRMKEVIAVGHFGWLPALESLLRPHPDVAVVVHSTWRHTHDDEELRRLLGPVGERIVGSTPPGSRYEGIKQWLHANPTYTSHRILNDDPTEFPQPLPVELIVCNPEVGVTGGEVAASLRRWLAS